MKAHKWTIVASIVVMACVEMAGPRAPRSGGSAERTISDAVHSSGNAHFYFLPPLVPSAATTGRFDAAVSPVVDICELAGNACGAATATFTMQSGPGSETVRVSPADQLYIVNWHTDQFSVDAGKTYRIRVIIAGAVAGFADVQVVLTARAAKNIQTSEYVPLVDGSTLPIKFRVEEQMVVNVAVTPAPATVVLHKTLALNATLTDAHGNVIQGQPIVWQSSNAATVSVAADGVVSGVALGGAEVRASSNGMVGFSHVDVVRPPIATINVDPSAISITAGLSTQLAATIKDADGVVLTDRNVDWSSSDESIATVDATGVVTAVVPGGPVTIVATGEGKSGSAQVTVTSAGFVARSGSLSVGHLASCAIGRFDGQTYCWGSNNSGALGTGSALPVQTTRPLLLSGGLHFDEVQMLDIGCGRTGDGVLYCWGSGSQGARGDGTNDGGLAPPVPVASSLHFLSLAESHCALATDKTAWCWDELRSYPTVPVQVSSMTFEKLYGGGSDVCGLTPSGDAYCWGYDLWGPYTPTQVGGSHAYVSLAVAEHSACGLDAAGYVWCWGDNTFGVYGDGTTSGNGGWLHPPKDAPSAGGLRFKSLHAGFFTLCGMGVDGMAYCWGHNGFGEVGDGTKVERHVPTLVATSVTFEDVIPGVFYMSCGLGTDGAVFCWGYNQEGELGNGTFNEPLPE